MFAHPDALWIVPLLLGLLSFSISVRTRRIRTLKAYLSAEPKDRFWPGSDRAPLSQSRWWTKGILLLAGGSSLVVALAGFQLGLGHTPEFRPRSPLFLMVDVSRSMAVEDVPWSRLGEAKLLIRRITTRFPGASVALTVFADEPHHLLPPGSDDGLLAMYVEALTTDMVTNQGTAIEPVLEEGLRLSKEAPEGQKPVFVLLSDGENEADRRRLVSAAADIRESGGTLTTVSFGTRAGGRVPPTEGPREFAVGSPGRRDASASTEPFSKADPELLRTLADAGGGRFASANDVEGVRSLMDWLESALGQVEASERDPVRIDRWWWWVLVAFLALVLESLMPGPFDGKRPESAR
jgi:Ca-activated chloride channel family protein